MALADTREGRALARILRDFDANVNRLRIAMTPGPSEPVNPVDSEGGECD